MLIAPKQVTTKRGSQVGTSYSMVQPKQIRGIAPDATAQGDLQFWYRQDLLQISAQMKTGGATPPAINLGGNLVASDQIHIATHSTGGVGIGTVDVDLNGSRVLTAQSTASPGNVAIPGSTATLVFPNSGTYSANNTWDSIVAQWRDKSGGGFTLPQATAALEPLLINDGTTLNGATIRFQSSSSTRFQRNDVAGDFANAIFGGVNAEFDVWLVCFINSVTTGQVLWHAGSTTDANLPMVQLAIASTSAVSGKAQIRRRFNGSAGNDKIIQSAIPVKTGQHVFRYRFVGGIATLWDNGVPIIGPGSGLSGDQTIASSLVLNTFSVGAQVTTTTSNFQNGDDYELFGYGKAQPTVSDTDAIGLYSYLDAGPR